MHAENFTARRAVLDRFHSTIRYRYRRNIPRRCVIGRTSRASSEAVVVLAAEGQDTCAARAVDEYISAEGAWLGAVLGLPFFGAKIGREPRRIPAPSEGYD